MGIRVRPLAIVEEALSADSTTLFQDKASGPDRSVRGRREASVDGQEAAEGLGAVLRGETFVVQLSAVHNGESGPVL